MTGSSADSSTTPESTATSGTAAPSSEAAATAAARAGLTLSQRAGGVRLSFHVWNTQADVEAALEVLTPFVSSTAGGSLRG